MNCFVFRMLINGKAFEGTTHYLESYRHLLASRGNIPWLSPIRLQDSNTSNSFNVSSTSSTCTTCVFILPDCWCITGWEL